MYKKRLSGNATMNTLFQKLFAMLLVAGFLSTSVSVAQQTGYKQINRPLSDPSIHEGASGEKSAGFKQNVDPSVGLLSASYIPFAGLGRAIGSLVQPYSKTSPASDHSSIGFKYNFSQLFFPMFSRTGRLDRLFAGFKGIGGRNVTDVAKLGQPGGNNPGDPWWVAYPRPGNVENPPPAQLVHHPYDCFCRWDETINCPLPESPFWHVNFGAPFVPPHFTPVKCQACFTPQRIRKHDKFVGTSKSGAFDGYPFSYPQDSGYLECLTQSIESYAASGPGGAVQGDPELYGL